MFDSFRDDRHDGQQPQMKKGHFIKTFDKWEEESFPFCFRRFENVRISKRHRNLDAAQDGFDLRHSRFLRRMGKKKLKQCKSDRGGVQLSGIDDAFKMPGSWVD